MKNELTDIAVESGGDYQKLKALVAERDSLRARVAELEAELAEQRSETDCWRGTARDKGESSRNASALRDRYRAAFLHVCESEGLNADAILARF